MAPPGAMLPHSPMHKKASLKRLLSPESIAVFGSTSAAQVIRQCRKVGFAGDMWPVHPNRDQLEGLPCFGAVSELPAAPDASFIGVGPETTIDLVRDLAAIGAGGAVCYAAGFAEAGEQGIRRQRELVEAAGPVALVGPNCHGLINYLDGVALWPDEHGGTRGDKGVAFVLQSGNIGISISMSQRSLPISYLITVGNKADLQLHDYIDVLLDDPRVTAIGLYIEGLDDVAAFAAAAMRALGKGVAIAAIKTGVSALGAEATMSHTSSLAGSNDYYEALFERVGIVRCSGLEEFLETLKFLSIVGPLPGRRIASMSCSGGDASMVADHADALGLTMPAFSDEARNSLFEVLGDKVRIGNPLDYHTYIWGNYDALHACFAAVLKEAADCTMLVIDYPHADICPAESWALAERALVDAAGATGQRAVIVSSLFENMPAAVRTRLVAAGIAPMQGLRDCLFAIRAAAIVGCAMSRHPDVRALPPVAGLSAGRRALDEWHSKQALAAFGLPVPAGRVCGSEDVGSAAKEIGFPVCLKIVSGDVAHKTEIGGVRIDLRDEQQLMSALDGMRSLSMTFLVEAMAARPVAEIIVGVKRDPQFGLALVIGAGGILVELVEDAATLLLPVTRDDIDRALSKLRVIRLIDGYRGQAPGDRSALVDAIVSVAEYANAHRDVLAELDVNPIMVLPRGVVAVDALIVVAD